MGKIVCILAILHAIQKRKKLQLMKVVVHVGQVMCDTAKIS